VRRLGERLVRHRKAVLVAWLVTVIIGFAASSLLFGRLDPDYKGASHTESVRALDRLGEQGPTIEVLLDGVVPTGSAVQQVLAGFVTEAQGAVPHVARILAPLPGPDGALPPEAAALLAEDGAAALVTVQLDAGVGKAQREDAVSWLREHAPSLQEQLREIDPQATVRLSGSPIVFETINQQINDDLLIAEVASLPVTAIVLVVVFAGLLPALLPIVGAFAAIAGGLLILLGFSYLLSLSSQVVPVVTMLGLGLSIDYSLLIVSRFREERSAGADVPQAVARTVEVAGRTVAFSAVTGAGALLRLVVFR